MEEFTITHSDMAITLSIIVPVYNVRRYLRRCVDSLLCQDIEKDQYEIILVDDGSTDGSENLCDLLAISESNVFVVHQVNQGLSSARNTGLDVAKGKFILFVDSDDWIEKYVLKGLLLQMEEDGLDVLRFGYRKVEGEEGGITIDSEKKYDPTREIWVGTDFLIQELGFSCYAWQFMIRRKLLTEHHLLFRQGIIFEDTEWTPRLLAKASRVSESNLVVYYYFQRNGSITNSAASRVVDGQMALIGFLIDQMDDLRDKRWYEGMIAHTVVSIVTLTSTRLYRQRKDILKGLSSKKIYPLSYFNASNSAKRKIGLINCSPVLACFIIHILNL